MKTPTLEGYYKEYYNRLIVLAMLFTEDPDRAHDLVHEAFEEAIKYPYNPSRGMGIYGYLVLLLRTRLTRSLARDDGFVRLDELPGDEADWLYHDPTAALFESIHLRETLERMTKVDYAIAVLFIQGYEGTEIAERLKMPPRLVQRHLERIARDFGLGPPLKQAAFPSLKPDAVRGREARLDVKIPVVEQPDGVSVPRHVGGAS